MFVDGQPTQVIKVATDLTTAQALMLYGSSKQGYSGDVNIPQPSVIDYVNYLKWNEWNAQKGIS